MKTKHHLAFYTILGLAILILLTLSFLFPDLKETLAPSNIKLFVLGFGSLAFLAYVIILAIAVPFPVPSEPFIFAGGYIFSAFIGIPLAFVGMVLGSTASFFLSRWAGRPLLKKLVDEHHLKHLDLIFKKKGQTAALISYVLPIFPSDTVSLFLGTTKLAFLPFLLLVILGHIPRVIIIILLGQYLPTGLTAQNIIITSFAVILILIVIFREKVKRFFFKELEEIEKGAVKIKKKINKKRKEALQKKKMIIMGSR